SLVRNPDRSDLNNPRTVHHPSPPARVLVSTSHYDCWPRTSTRSLSDATAPRALPEAFTAPSTPRSAWGSLLPKGPKKRVHVAAELDDPGKTWSDANRVSFRKDDPDGILPHSCYRTSCASSRLNTAVGTASHRHERRGDRHGQDGPGLWNGRADGPPTSVRGG